VVHTNMKDAAATEAMAAQCQDLLRRSLRRILEAPEELRDHFCQTTKSSAAAIDRFYNALVNFGSFNSAVDWWIAADVTNT
jgi:hypothetical protein